MLTCSHLSYQPVLRITQPVNFAYCQRNSYGHHEVLIDDNLPWAEKVWSKIGLIKRYLPGCDWLMWIDADAMVMNHTFSLESIIAGCQEGTDLIICKDYPTGDPKGINAGVFLIRNCEWSLAYFRHVEEHKPNYIGLKYPEQMAMEACMPYGFNIQHIAFVPHWMLNQFWTSWRPGDFIVHHAGGSVEDKVKGLTPFLEKVIR